MHVLLFEIMNNYMKMYFFPKVLLRSVMTPFVFDPLS
jgi:hypothetical protein